MKIFWKICRWAAVGLMILPLVWITNIWLADSGLCQSDKSAVRCPGIPGSEILSYISILPIAVLVGAPVILFYSVGNLLTTGSLPQELGSSPLGFKLTIVVSCAWFVLGVIGLFNWVFSLKAKLQKTKSD